MTAGSLSLPKKRNFGSLAAALIVLAVLGAACGRPEGPGPGRTTGAVPVSGHPVIGIGELSRLDLLPKLKQSIKVGSVSSYDRTGGNDDGFSGKYSFIRKEPGGLVLADLEGPGVITRIHTPSPTDDVIEFYFDGESVPRISRKINALFDGTHAPFLAPLVGAGVGGRYCYLPITFQRSCKVLVKAETFQFYQINYAKFPADFAVPSFEEKPSQAFLEALDAAQRIFGMSGRDISAYLVPPGTGTKIRTEIKRVTLKPGGTATLFKSSRGGRIVGLRLSPAGALAGKARDIVLRIFWDGASEPAVECPAGDFFGASFGEPAVRSLLLGTSGSTDYCYFPMPFERSARIELVSERTEGPAVDVEAEVTFAPVAKAPDEGRFYALWRRENPTREGEPYTFLNVAGRGHVVGVILQAQGLEPGQTPFFEGDDVATIDGELAVPGTGSEDSFNGGWYDVPARWENRGSYPLSGCLDYKKPLGRTGGYRWFVTDSYAYRTAIKFTIEHGPEGNKVPTDYASVVFFYSLEPPQYAPAGPEGRFAGTNKGGREAKGSELLPVEARQVTDPPKIVFVPGWNVPVHTTSLENFGLAKRTEKIGEAWARYLAMTTSGGDIFGPHHVSFICDLPAAGRYKVGVKAVLGPDQGIVRIFRNDLPAGEPVDLFAETRAVSPVLPLGVFDMNAGDNIVFLHLVGKNTRSKAMGFALTELIFERSGSDQIK